MVTFRQARHIKLAHSSWRSWKQFFELPEVKDAIQFPNEYSFLSNGSGETLVFLQGKILRGI